MKTLVFGSLNIDRVYSISHLPERGETLSCSNYEIHVGGKGLNQAVSFKKAGADVSMAGCIGKDGEMLKAFLEESGVDTAFVEISDGFTGHAVIEVDPEGQNQMVLFPGANFCIKPDFCDRVLEGFSAGDLVLMEYETSCVEYMINSAKAKGLKTALNPSPYTDNIKELPLEKIDYLILNEYEGKQLSGTEGTEETVRELQRITGGVIITTLGGDGAVYFDGKTFISVPAFKVNAVDTTGAGDTFTGYCLNALLEGTAPAEALRFACAASAIACTKPGAAQTIPEREAVQSFLETH